MSAGNLQEMELKSQAKQSKTAVNAGAKPADPMPSNAEFVAGVPGQSITDLGGPTPDNYRSTDDSAKYASPAVKTVRDVVNAKAARAEEVEVEEDQEVVAEEEVVEETSDELEFNVAEDIKAIFGDEDLSEEFKERAALVFESALKTKVAEAVEIMEKRYEELLHNAFP